jgi:hypothetical protein
MQIKAQAPIPETRSANDDKAAAVTEKELVSTTLISSD